MKQYLDLVRTILDTGTWQENRTGIRTISMPGAMLRFDLQQGFPAVTTKKLAFKSAIGEMVGFLRASRSAADFRDLGCKVWDANANQNPQWLANPYREGPDDLGDVYGVQWRKWPAYKVLDAARQRADRRCDRRAAIQVVTEFDEDGGRKVLLYKAIDQLRQCLDTIMQNPADRRILFHAWNPAVLDEIALPACHLLYQFLPNAARREISLCLYIRSNDVGPRHAVQSDRRRGVAASGRAADGLYAALVHVLHRRRAHLREPARHAAAATHARAVREPGSSRFPTACRTMRRPACTSRSGWRKSSRRISR